MNKILVIGCPGSGKSTFARKLHAITGIPLHPMDLLFWHADKTSITRSELTEKLQIIMSEDSWIIDGNYKSTLDLRLSCCETVFFLDYPLELCLEGVKSRAGKPRPDMPWIETDADTDGMLEYMRSFFLNDLKEIRQLLKHHPEIDLHIFHTRDEAQTYLDNLK